MSIQNVENAVPKSSHRYLGMCLALGAAFGVAIHQLGLGIALGVAIGAALDQRAGVSSHTDKQPERDDNV